MIVIYGKGKVGHGLDDLLTYLAIDHYIMDDENYDQKVLDSALSIVASPGIKPSHKLYEINKDKILSELSYLGLLLPTLDLPPIVSIGITGTNGKSTSSWVMYQLLQKVFPQKKIWLTGNFDVPLSQTILSIIKDGKDQEHICVVETSSFMLYNLTHFTFDYGLFLNIARDHLDWHKTMQEYTAAKIRLCEQSRAFVTSESIYKKLPHTLQKKGSFFTNSIDISQTSFIGSHNIQNISGVLACTELLCHDLGISIDLHTFLPDIKPLPHRLETIKKVNGIRIVDDGISTSAQSLSAALDSVDQCVAIVGGYNKGDDYSILSTLIKNKTTCLVCIGQTKSIFSSLASSVGVDYIFADTLEESIHLALDAASNKHTFTVLFSPGAASFDMFKNVYDRIDQFTRIVNSL